MREYLNDLVYHTNTLGVFDKVKISVENDVVHFEAVDDDKTIILNGKFKGNVKEFAGVFGISDMNRLGSLLNHPNFVHENAKLTIGTKDQDGVAVPTEINFENKELYTKAQHRLASAEMLPEAKFKGTEWEVEFSPDKSKINEFLSFAAIENGREEYFMPKVENGKLMIYFGEQNASTHSSKMCFATEVKKDISKDLYWKIDDTVAVLKLSKQQPVISITGKGALQIKVASEFGEYRYILRAHKK